MGITQMIASIVGSIVWYLFITLVMAVVAIFYNHVLNQDRWRLIPVCLKVVAGTTITEILRVTRSLPFVCIAAWYIANSLGIDGSVIILLITSLMIAVWTTDSILGYAATGIPLIWGDMLRWARAIKMRESAELPERVLKEMDERTAKDRGN